MNNSFLLLLCLLFCSNLQGQYPNLSNNEKTAVNEAMNQELVFQEINGLAIGIVREGKIVYTKGYGFMDESRTKRVNSETIFNWASISKTLTAVAAFQLIEKGKLKLEDKPKSILDGIWTNPDDKNQIMVKHLLAHRSGIRQYNKSRNKDIKYD